MIKLCRSLFSKSIVMLAMLSTMSVLCACEPEDINPDNKNNEHTHDQKKEDPGTDLNGNKDF